VWFGLYVLIRPVDRKEFERRTFPHAYDVMIYQEGGHYYARDEYGNIICVDSQTKCLREGIDYGKHIHVKGVFDLTDPITITSGKIIYIDGYISSINISNYSSDIEIIGRSRRDYHIGNLYIDGGAARHTFRDLFINNTTIRNGGHILFDSCTFNYVNLQGYDYSNLPYWITFLRSWISNRDGNAVDISMAVNILFISSVIAYSNGVGININNYGRNIKIINSIIEGNKTGIAFVGGQIPSDVVVEGTVLYANKDYGIYMNGPSIVIIRDRSHVRSSTIDILINSLNSVLIIDRESLIDSISGLDKLTYFKSDNPSYLSRNMGQATIPTNATSVTVSHGLICVPKKVLVTPLAQPPGSIWVSNITNTSFTINTSTATTTDLPVAWHAEC